MVCIKNVLAATLLALGLFFVGAVSWASDTPPDGTLIQVFSGEKDACSRKNVVSIPGRNGRVEIRAGETKWIHFEALKCTFYYRCGDTEEKWEYKDVQAFDVIKAERSADTGRISWTCYRLSK